MYPRAAKPARRPVQCPKETVLEENSPERARIRLLEALAVPGTSCETMYSMAIRADLGPEAAQLLASLCYVEPVARLSTAYAVWGKVRLALVRTRTSAWQTLDSSGDIVSHEARARASRHHPAYVDQGGRDPAAVQNQYQCKEDPSVRPLRMRRLVQECHGGERRAQAVLGRSFIRLTNAGDVMRTEATPPPGIVAVPVENSPDGITRGVVRGLSTVAEFAAIAVHYGADPKKLLDVQFGAGVGECIVPRARNSTTPCWVPRMLRTCFEPIETELSPIFRAIGWARARQVLSGNAPPRPAPGPDALCQDIVRRIAPYTRGLEVSAVTIHAADLLRTLVSRWEVFPLDLVRDLASPDVNGQCPLDAIDCIGVLYAGWLSAATRASFSVRRGWMHAVSLQYLWDQLRAHRMVRQYVQFFTVRSPYQEYRRVPALGSAWHVDPRRSVQIQYADTVPAPIPEFPVPRGVLCGAPEFPGPVHPELLANRSPFWFPPEVQLSAPVPHDPRELLVRDEDGSIVAGPPVRISLPCDESGGPGAVAQCWKSARAVQNDAPACQDWNADPPFTPSRFPAKTNPVLVLDPVPQDVPDEGFTVPATVPQPTRKEPYGEVEVAPPSLRYPAYRERSTTDSGTWPCDSWFDLTAACDELGTELGSPESPAVAIAERLWDGGKPEQLGAGLALAFAPRCAPLRVPCADTWPEYHEPAGAKTLSAAERDVAAALAPGILVLNALLPEQKAARAMEVLCESAASYTWRYRREVNWARFESRVQDRDTTVSDTVALVPHCDSPAAYLATFMMAQWLPEYARAPLSYLSAQLAKGPTAPAVLILLAVAALRWVLRLVSYAGTGASGCTVRLMVALYHHSIYLAQRSAAAANPSLSAVSAVQPKPRVIVARQIMGDVWQSQSCLANFAGFVTFGLLRVDPGEENDWGTASAALYVLGTVDVPAHQHLLFPGDNLALCSTNSSGRGLYFRWEPLESEVGSAAHIARQRDLCVLSQQRIDSRPLPTVESCSAPRNPEPYTGKPMMLYSGMPVQVCFGGLGSQVGLFHGGIPVSCETFNEAAYRMRTTHGWYPPADWPYDVRLLCAAKPIHPSHGGIPVYQYADNAWSVCQWQGIDTDGRAAAPAPASEDA